MKRFTTLWFILFISFFLNLTKPQYNVLLISIDTLRSDALGCYNSKQKTPAIDTLAARSVLFENTISQVPLTLPSHVTIFTGLFPQQHGIKNNEIYVMPEKLITLVEIFQKNGYKTGGVAGSFALDSGFGIAQGFDFYDDAIDSAKNPENRYVERRAETVWKIGQQWINSQNGSWFCFLHFYDPHTAYSPPKPYPQTYQGEVAYVDQVMGKLTTFLNDTGRYNTTLVVLLSDHGESLGEHGEDSHGVFLYDSTLKVPFLISAPGLKPARIKQLVRLADVGPTILELAGMPSFPSQSSTTGVSLVSMMKGEQKELFAYSETYYTNLLMGWAPLHSIRTDQLKWIDAPKTELYNLSSDPMEKRNLYSRGSVPPSLKREMERYSKTTAIEQPGGLADPELKERLASLGYVTGSTSTNTGQATFDPKDGIQAWSKIETAVTSAQIGKLPEAEKGFKEALRIQPDNVIAQKFFANVLAKQNKVDEAILYLKKAIESPLHQEETRVDLAKIFYAKEQYAQAIDTLMPIVGKTTQNAVALKLAGLSAAHSKQFDASSDFLERALELKPKDPDCLSTLARIFSYENKSEEALQKYQELETVRALTEEEAVQTAAIYLTENNSSSAETYFQKAIQTNPESTKAWHGMALIHASHKQWSEAASAFLKANDCEGARKILSAHLDLSQELQSAIKMQCVKE